ncbi:Geranylgeranyl diphosphate reductase [hydrothermal vent metagenome]|uniref:Geranylgeranyl diphosphate reductase n=1 Tax=hydrothermal vent metagenome TaxID=652676 RepID=A0A1W1CID6_9ZZZZ
MRETNILIVGGGPAGAQTARYLSSSNIDNILVQRSLKFKKPCGGGIRQDAFDEFELDTKEIIKKVDEVLFVHNENKIKIDISMVGVAIVDRASFDNSLRVDAQEKGTQILEATFISIEVFSEYLVSKIKIGDKYTYIKSKYVVAADGVNSKLRKLINNDEVSSTLTQYCDITAVEQNTCDFHFGRDVAGGHYAWVFPHSDGVDIGTLIDSTDAFNRLKQSLNIQTDVKTLGYKIPEYKNTIFYKDSASQVLPFTYEGIYYALASAKILCDVIINDNEPESYEKVWKNKFHKKFKVLMLLQKVFLYNEFMIRVMMKLFSHKSLHKRVLELWIGKQSIEVNFNFFVKVMKYMFRKA